MGLLIQNQFETSEGFQVSQVYTRPSVVSINLESNTATVELQFALTRELRLARRQLSAVPFTSPVVSFSVPAFPTIEMVYFHLTRYFTSLGLSVSDVLEPGQTPSTYTEPDPIETPPNAGNQTTMLSSP